MSKTLSSTLLYSLFLSYDKHTSHLVGLGTVRRPEVASSRELRGKGGQYDIYHNQIGKQQCRPIGAISIPLSNTHAVLPLCH